MPIAWVLRLPFKLIGAAGFDAGKIEQSVFGRLLKLAFGLASFIAAVVVIADHWDMIRRFVHR
jgi:hypothetical protein